MITKNFHNNINPKNFNPDVLRLTEAGICPVIFSYNSNAVFQASSATVNDQATNLLVMLRQKRRRQAPPKPLIFICHSLGGLLVKRALCVAYLADAYKKNIYDSTKGLVFFGTPHGGGQNVSVGNIAVRILGTITNNPDNSYMDALRRNSLCSEQNREDFIQRADDFDFVSIIEGKKTKGVTVVSKEHSVLGLSLSKEKKISVDASHTEICKFWDPAGRAWSAVVKDPIMELAEDAIAAAEIPATPAQAQAPPAVNQITIVPYLENTKFHGRDNQLAEICQFFSPRPGPQTSQRRLVLQGFPGIGKTTLALQYSIDHGSEYEGVFWVNALVTDTIDAGGQGSTSREVDMIEREYEKLDQEVKKRTNMTFREWCSDKKWLLVIDNLEDPTQFNAGMIPPGPGDVLITSRHRGLNQLGTVMPIPPLDEQIAADLLCTYGENRRTEDDDAANALKIVRMLGCVPLAIRHCGCLVSEQETRLSSYIQEFDDLMTELVTPEDRGDVFDLNESKPLLKTFEISLTYLNRRSVDAANMLVLMANLDPTEISEDMLRRCLQPHRRWNEDGNIETSLVPQIRSWLKDLPDKDRGRGLEVALKTLVRYSLIFRKIEKGSYFLHPLTHFWLRWKQETNHNLEPFADSLALLENGFPQPDFSRTYGLTNEHHFLRELFMPHVQHMLKRYHRLKTMCDEHEDLVLQLATLFLNASDTPQELRPLKQRVREILPGTETALPQGRLIDPFQQDVTFLETLEDIIPRLQYPSSLFFRAIYVFFDHIYKVWSAQHPRTAYQVRDLGFAGQSLVDIRTRIAGQTVNYVLSSNDPDQNTDDPLQDEKEDIMKLMPLIDDPGDTGTVDSALDKQSGLIGLIGEFIPIPATKLCDLTRFAHAQHVLQIYQAKNDTGELREYWSSLRLWATYASIKLNRLIGVGSVLGAESLYMMIWDGTRNHPPQAWIRDEQLGSMLSSPITLENFYFKIKLIDAWQYNMAARGMPEVTEALILTQLVRFLNCDTNLRKYWDFGIDPVLDLYEYAIHLYMVWIPDPEKASNYQARYLSHFEREYGTLDERLCLGCGVGVFGLRHARLRAYTGTKGPQGAREYAFGLELFRRLKEKLGAAGSCLPNGDEETTRLAEQEWCFMRNRAYYQALGVRLSGGTSTFGNASWNAMFPHSDTQDTALFQAEAARVRRIVIDVYSEILSVGPLEPTAEEVEEDPVATGRDAGPSTLPVADTVSDVVSDEQGATEAETSQPGPSHQNSGDVSSGDTSSRQASRLSRVLQRVGISRKGKERA